MVRGAPRAKARHCQAAGGDFAVLAEADGAGAPRRQMGAAAC